MSDWSICMDCGDPTPLAALIGEMRLREPLRNDQWIKGYHAALHDIEVAAKIGER